MNQNDKIVLKTQFQAISAQMGAFANLASSGSSMPIITPMGPGSAPGIMQMGAAIRQQINATQQLISLVIKLVDAV